MRFEAAWVMEENRGLMASCRGDGDCSSHGGDLVAGRGQIRGRTGS